MTDQLESKIINLCVRKPWNGPAIATMFCLDLDYLESQFDSPKLIHSLPSRMRASSTFEWRGVR